MPSPKNRARTSWARVVLAICALGLLARVASQCADVKKDPHLAFARGGRADFRGRNGAYYSFLSTPSFAINVRTEEAQFKTYRDALTVDGSFITEVHGVAQVGGEKHKLATASFWTSELNEFTTGPNMINGTCGDRGQFFLGTGGYKKCEEMEILVRFSSARFRVPGWVIKVAAAPVFGRISGPRHRLDVSLHAHGDEAALAQTHGLVGQSFAWRTARDGKRDLYPSEGRFRTSAMAEGAIEGNGHVRAPGSAGDGVCLLALPRSKAADASPPGRRNSGGRLVNRPGGGCWRGERASCRAQARRGGAAVRAASGTTDSRRWRTPRFLRVRSLH